ncbi:MAG TPA: hypothetical protein VE547_07115, partial [Mycobacteriales bacterium]|nr:hypothetical protein [Mycobacteriales bacterium]
EQEAARLARQADHERSEADRLRDQARKLAPHLDDDDRGAVRTDHAGAMGTDQAGALRTDHSGDAGDPRARHLAAYDADGRPVDADGRPVDADGRPLDRDGRPLDAGRRHADDRDPDGIPTDHIPAADPDRAGSRPGTHGLRDDADDAAARAAAEAERADRADRAAHRAADEAAHRTDERR